MDERSLQQQMQQQMQQHIQQMQQHTMREADFRYECSELVEWALWSSRADALTAPAA